MLTKARRLALGVMVPLVLAIGLAAPASVAGATAAPVSVAFKTPPVGVIGSEVIVTGTIRRADRVSPLGLRVALYFNGKFLLSSHADVAGRLSFRISGGTVSTAGTFDLQARFDGAHLLLPARASTKLKVRPAVVKIMTVPAVSGVPISVGDKTAMTGADGSATLSIAKVGALPLEAHLDLVSDQSIRVSFIRWGDQVFDIRRAISVRGDATYVLGLRTAYRASVKFVDQTGTPVDPSTISRARFTSSTGGELVLTTFDSAWWEAGTAVSRTGGLQPSSTLWRLSEVEMAGTNVVNQGQQAFSPTIDGTWTVGLLLYDLVVHTQDALTGSSLPGTAELVFPDSTSRTSPVAADGSVRFEGLPRGSYVVKLKTDGMAPPTPVALSRSQDATIRVISYFDLGAAASLGLLVLLALLWIGRRRQIPLLMRASAAPMAIARRLSVDSAPGARRGLPAARTAVGMVSSDLASIGRGRLATALGFGRFLLASLARMVVTLVNWVIRLVVAAARRIAPGVGGQRVTSERSGPSWPSSSGGDMVPVIHPPVIVRATRPGAAPIRQERESATGGRGWFDVPTDDEGPTHECRTCHRQVPDSARFCRSCGHIQE